MSNMIRTQIYFPKSQYDDVKLRAKLAGKPAAEVVRELVALGLKSESIRPATAYRALDELSKLKFKGGPKDLSQNIDHYLYD